MPNGLLHVLPGSADPLDLAVSLSSLFSAVFATILGPAFGSLGFSLATLIVVWHSVGGIEPDMVVAWVNIRETDALHHRSSDDILVKSQKDSMRCRTYLLDILVGVALVILQTL